MESLELKQRGSIITSNFKRLLPKRLLQICLLHQNLSSHRSTHRVTVLFEYWIIAYVTNTLFSGVFGKRGRV